MFNRCILLIFLFLLLPVAASAEKNYYEVLGVSQTASLEEIKKAYKTMVQKYHPDRNTDPDAKKRTVEINIAYGVLKDPAKRRQYDDFGHEQFTESGDSKKSGDSFSQVFEDIFKREENPKHQSRTYSIKAIQLFQMLLVNKMTIQQSNRRFFGPKNMRNITRQQKLIEITLKELLKEVGISGFHKDTFTRILKDFYGEFPEKKRKRLIAIFLSQSSTGKASASQSTKIKLHSPDPIWQSALQKFIENIEVRYVVHNSTGKEKKAVELFHRFSFFNQSSKDYLENRTRHLELLKNRNEKSGLTMAEKTELHGFERQERKDIHTLRQVLSALGLPEQVHHDFLLRAYLDGLKQSLFDREKPFNGVKMLSSDGIHSRTVYMENKNIIEALKNIKTTFDNLQYENLKTMNKTFSFKSLKNYPGMFISLNFAIGASLYRQTLTDPYIYGAERNPGMLNEFIGHSTSPSGLASLFIFFAVSQKVHYRLYGLGRSIDGKSLKTPFGSIHFNGKLGRAIGPGAGLGAGFFLSSLFVELVNDPFLTQCVKQLMSSNSDGESIDFQQTDPCDEFYLNWISNPDKWKHYTVDIATLIGSGTLSFKLVSSTLRAVRATATGSQMLWRATKFVGLTVSRWSRIVAGLVLFMEIHPLMDEWIGQPLKEQWTAAGIKNDLLYLTDLMPRELDELSFYASHLDTADESSRHTNLFEETISRAEMNIKQLGRKFQHWSMARSQFHIRSAHFQSQKLNKFLMPYESSSSLLKDIFLLSHLNYGQKISKNSQPWDSDEDISKAERNWDDLIALFSFSGSKFIEKREFFKDNYCSLIDESFDNWSQFCADPDNFSYGKEQETPLVYETAHLIYRYLSTIPSPRNTINNNNFMNYLGRTFNEMFSSDPQYFFQKLSHDEKFLLARTLLKSSLTENDISSHFEDYEILKFKKAYCTSIFPNHATDENQQLWFEYCLYTSEQIKSLCTDLHPKDSQPENYKTCFSELNFPTQYLDKKLRNKFLSAGIYVLKDLTSDLKNRGKINHLSINNLNVFHSILPLMDLLKVYKKGEIKFIISKEFFEANKSIIKSSQIKAWKLSYSFHFFMKNLVCGEKEPDSDYSFSIPQLFSNTEIFIYSFYSNKFKKLSTACNIAVFLLKNNKKNFLSIFHEFLFNRPVQNQGKSYENLYLALEDILKTNYSSSQNLADHFQKLSQDQLDESGAQLSNKLQDLTENYYKNLINVDTGIKQSSSLQDFADYYHKNRILFDIRSFTGGLKGLEISLFQVNYWMEMLKQMLSIGEQKNNDGDSSLNQIFHEWKGFDQSAFEKNAVGSSFTPTVLP